MNVSILFFMLAAVVLLILLVWAVRPAKPISLPADQVLELLSRERHYSRLPQILCALRPDDLVYLRTRGRAELATSLQHDRRRVALQFINLLQEDFELLLEASRVLATVSPEVIPIHELERFRLSARFAFYCRFLQWRLRLGLAPRTGFEKISEMASDMAFRLDSAASLLSERSALASEFPSLRD